MNIKSAASTNFENEQIKTLPDGTKYIIPPNKFLSGGPPKDGIPSIDNPKFISAAKADWLSDGELGLELSTKMKQGFIHSGSLFIMKL